MTTTAAREAEPALYLPVTPEEARRNRQVLDDAVREHEQARKRARLNRAVPETGTNKENR